MIYYSLVRLIYRVIANLASLLGVLKPSTATAEGVTAAAGAHIRAMQIALYMPICNAIYRLLHENMPPLEAVESLLSRPPSKI